MVAIKRIEGWKKVFLHHVGNGQPDIAAAQLTQVGLDRLYKARDNDAEFAAAWAAAKEGNSYENRTRW